MVKIGQCGWRWRSVGVVGVAGAAALAMGAATASAAARVATGEPPTSVSCPSLVGIGPLSGSINSNYTESQSGGGEAVSMQHVASGVAVKLEAPSGDPFGSLGTASGGTLSAQDSAGNGNYTVTENGSGPTDEGDESASIDFYPDICSYALTVDYQLNTVETDSTDSSDNANQVLDIVTVNPVSYAGDLKNGTLSLSGSLSIPAYTYQVPEAPDDSLASSYQLGSETPPYYDWPSNMSTTWGGGVNSNVQVGSATVSFSLTGTIPTHCVVPDVLGLKLAAAKRKLTAANCTLGQIYHQRSRYRAGLIDASYPRAGSILLDHARVSLAVSSGR